MAAFSIVSETHTTRSTVKELFDFLSDFKNFHEILPHDRVENFQYTENECSFAIKGMTPLKVTMVEKKPYDHILFSSSGVGQFKFFLKAMFSGAPETPGQCHIDLSGDMNPFITKMAERPLTALVNTMSERLSKL